MFSFVGRSFIPKVRRCVHEIAHRKAHKMPKSKKGKDPAPKPVVVSCTGPVTRSEDGNINIVILAKPGAKQNTITDLSPEGVGVQISAPPREGEANTELCRYLASVLGVKKTAVTLNKGSKSRNKVVLVRESGLSADAALNKLKHELDNG